MRRPVEHHGLPVCLRIMESNKQIWTIGHSNRAENTFLDLLQSYDIKILADIRTFPGSRKYPYFNKEVLEQSLPAAGMRYFHMPELGGRRKPRPDSTNIVWKNESFRGYADYMETENFREGIEKLEELATNWNLAYMCSEALWWKCHRALVSDFLKVRGWKVLHINDPAKLQEHPFTSPAKETQGQLFYE